MPVQQPAVTDDRSGAPELRADRHRLGDHMTIASGGMWVAVSGEVDASNAGRLRRAILHCAPGRGGRLEVDLAGVTFMDSCGLRAIDDAARALEPLGSGLVLSNVPRRVLRIIEITGLGHFEILE